MGSFSEKNCSKEPALNVLKKLGWRIADPSEVKRKDKRNPLYERELIESLKKLNPGINDIDIEKIIEIIKKDIFKKFELKTNKEKYELLVKNPIKKNDDLKVNSENNGPEYVKIFDFKNVENNLFTAVPELIIHNFEEKEKNCRVDTVGFVNGIPLLFIEYKKLSKNLEKEAYEGNYKKYLQEIPQLFAFNAFCVLTNRMESKIGAFGNSYQWFSDWKRLKEEDFEGDTKIETLIEGVCQKDNFLDLLQNFTLFREDKKELKKVIAKNHQFLGVNKAVVSYLKREENKGKLGTFWHTQGSGKSLSILFFAKKINRTIKGNRKILIITDREDLENQLYSIFNSFGDFKNSSQIKKVSSQFDLLGSLRDGQSRYIFSLIQKFGDRDERKIRKKERINKEVVIIVDEAHRSQYGELACEMFEYFTNFSVIGFTGTPLLKQDKTRLLFGDYVSKYEFEKAIIDGITVPLYYDNRTKELQIKGVDTPFFDNSYVEKADLDEFDFEKDEKNLLEEYCLISQQLRAEKRLKAIAKDFVSYYSTKISLGKAILACLDRKICIVMWNYVEKYWKEEIENLKHKFNSLSTCSEFNEKNKRKNIEETIKLMENTIMTYVISEESNIREEDLKIYGEDIKKDCRGWKISDVEKNFKEKCKEECNKGCKVGCNPLRIAFVCQKWLTGFDVPSLYFLFLDRPLREHSLMQAITRPNRVDIGKTEGIIVDFINAQKSLENAVNDYSPERNSKIVQITPINELKKNITVIIQEIKNFLSEHDISLKELIEEENNTTRMEILKEFKKQLDKCVDLTKFNENCVFLFRKFSFLDEVIIKKYCKEVEAIEEIYNFLKLQEDAKTNNYLSPEISKIMMTKRINECVEVKENQNYPGKIKVTDLKNQKIDKLDKDILEINQLIEKNFNRKKNQKKKESFEKELAKIIEEWNSSIIDARERIKKLKKNIEEDNDNYQINKLNNYAEQAIFEHFEELFKNRNFEITRIRDFCIQLPQELFIFLKENDRPFEKNTTQAQIRSLIRCELCRKFPEISENEESWKAMESFIYIFFSDIYKNKQEFIEAYKTYGLN